jgi:hypothetical protein
MRAIDQALAGSCQWGANPFRPGKDSQRFVGLPGAIKQHRLGIHATALQGGKMGERVLQSRSRKGAPFHHTTILRRWSC